jgi:arylsulfatase A-like enzyme
MYAPADMPAAVRAPTIEDEAAQHPLLAWYMRNSKQGSFFRRGEGLVAALDSAEIAQMRATYYGLISEVDESLGRVIDYLDETGQWENTLVVFTSDHGEQLGDHHLLGKIGYFDESFRIPLVIVDPDAKHTRGTIVDAFTESVDIMPTLLEWLGGTAPRTCDGHSLLPFLHGQSPEGWRDALHYEFDFRNVFPNDHEGELGLHMDDCTLSVLQDDAFKYVHFTALPALLFDLKADPNQFRNLADDPAYASVVRDYAQRALSWRMRHADRTLTHFRATPDGLEERGQRPTKETSQ